MNVTELEDMAKERAREIVESGEEHIPLFLMDTPVGCAVGLFEIPDEAGKDRFRPIFTELLRQHRASAYVLVCEAWMTTSRRPFVEDIQISQLPPDDREDVLWIISCMRGGIPKMTSAVVNNTPQGRRLNPWREWSGVSLGGRMVVSQW